MAKSKEQKQQEALERKRSLYSFKQQERTAWSFVGHLYQKALKNHGHVYADKRLCEANQVWLNYLKEAQIDSHGNPL